jgi:hypothetical protein
MREVLMERDCLVVDDATVLLGLQQWWLLVVLVWKEDMTARVYLLFFFLSFLKKGERR